MKKYFLFFLLLTFAKQTIAQDDVYLGSAALPFLVLQQSPMLIGAGDIGTANPMQETMGFYYNPAQLGYFSRNNSLSGFFMPQKTKWSPGFNLPASTLQSSGLTLGYNYRSMKLPLSFGFGYINSKLDYGDVIVNNSASPVDYNSYDYFDCYSFGLGFDYYINFNLGFSVKTYRSVLGTDLIDNRTVSHRARGTAFDFGIMAITPISKLLLRNARYNLSDEISLAPDFNFTLGYSISNIGKKVSYTDPAQGDPLPRTARLGYSFNLGTDLLLYGTKINAFNYSFTAEAEDLLLRRNSDTTGINYQGLFGDIEFGSHLIKLQSDSRVTVHRGHIFRFFDTFYLTTGRINRGAFLNYKSNGIGISSEGVFKLLNIIIDNSAINYIAEHWVLEYYNTNAMIDTPFERNYKGIALYYRAFGF